MDPTAASSCGAGQEPQPQRGAGKPDFVTMNVGAKWFGRSPIGWSSSGKSIEWMGILTKNPHGGRRGLQGAGASLLFPLTLRPSFSLLLEVFTVCYEFL